MNIETDRPLRFDQVTPPDKKKSPNRMRYDAEIRVIRARVGNLEDIRAKLGLTRRKICQLLLVDPSAWTRWTSSGGQAPPHIYRALEWYLLLIEKDPRALMPIGTWSSNLFEDRFQMLETGIQQMAKARAGLMAAVFLVGAIGGAILMLVLR
ncbi:MAG: hypothetical protein KF799_11670 [Bdellovibrionales bacterium]|nr:hypothetical protein [Bdellovibrionales bacterium]